MIASISVAKATAISEAMPIVPSNAMALTSRSTRGANPMRAKAAVEAARLRSSSAAPSM